MKRKFTLTLAALSLLTPLFALAQVDPIEERVESLLSKMTLEAKIGQMHQINTRGGVERLGKLAAEGSIGSILNEIDPAIINEVQRIAIEESEFGIPLIVARDVIHGFKTIFPIPLGQAATFNPSIVEQGARVAARETSSVGIRWTFAPMIDVSRDPRWGRIAESCGEDPYLNSIMGAAMIKGFQGDDLSDPSSIAACAKHFVGYGAAEGGVDYNSTNIPERQLRNVYLPPFEAAVEAGAATFMTSFNDNDGIPATANKFLLKDVLRDEWGFKGFVVTDWGSSTEMIAHGFASSTEDVAIKTLNAGVDMEMVGGTYMRHLKSLIDSGVVSEEAIDEAVRNILRIKFKLGLFENPYVDLDAKDKTLYAESHLAAAKEAVVQSAILLKNDNSTLPLKGVKRVAIVGPMADAPHDQMGTWVFDGEKEHTQTPLNAIREIYGDDVEVIYQAGLTYSRDYNSANISKAVEAAKSADVVIAFVGEESILSGEAHSLADIGLKGAQSELVAALGECGTPLITVFMAGRPLTIAQEVDASDAVIYMFHPGTMGGPAIADLLFGKASPSGKTPVTFPRMVGQVPIYYAHNNTGRPSKGRETLIDDIPLEAGQTSLGCTSFYLDAGFTPLFPFGYGLSYSTFDFENIAINKSQFSPDEDIVVTFDLVNSGSYDAAEVAQLYIRDKVGSVTRPVKELKGFQRVELKAGERKTVEFKLPVEELAFYNIDMERVVEPGDFELWVAPDSQSGTAIPFTVK